MVGLYIRYRDQGSQYLQFKKPLITLGSAQRCDLVLRDARGIDDEHCVLSYIDDAWKVDALAEVLVDGRPLAPATSARVADGATLAVGEYMVDLAFDPDARWRVTLDPKERQLLAAIAANDHASREIYADWLEEQDQREKAAYVRAQLRVFAGSHDTAAKRQAFTAAADELRGVAERLDPRWRRALAQAPIENCHHELKFEVPCPVDWAALAATQEPGVRHCGVCAKSVHYCSTIHQALDHARRGKCVVVDVVEPRVDGDLRVVQMRGRMAPPSRR